MKSKWMSAALFLTLTTLASAYNYLSVLDPHGWQSGQGTIEEAVISVQPRGIYYEYGLYLTFSAKNLNFNAATQYEVDYFFDLPQETIMHDSWLWVGDDIIQGVILDKWTASQIYEDIVSRRRDPSILFKRGNNDYNKSTQYELRIYPMLGNETRKVKLTFLMPAQWNASKVFASLPTELLRTSYTPVNTFYVLSWLGDEWKNPQIVEFPNHKFIQKSDTKFGKYYRVDLPNESIQAGLNFSVDAPFQNGVYFNHLNGKDENIYQLAMLPSEALDIHSNHQVVVLVNYLASNSTVKVTDMLSRLKANLHSYLSDEDQFNIIISRLNIERLSDTWLSADSATIEETFTKLGENPSSFYVSLPQLLANGIDFIKEHGNDGSMILISNSDLEGDYQVSNGLINDLMDLMDPILPVHVADLQDKNYQYYYMGGRSYLGNEYFYSNITRMTSGNFSSILNGLTNTEVMSEIFESLGGFISSFDLHTKVEDGYCFGRYFMDEMGETVYLNRPILQVGKYFGSLPLIIETSGKYKSQVFSETLQISQDQAFPTDSLAETIWAGNYIKALEAQTQTNDVVSEIISVSTRERILSDYTAFLCLEPSQGGEIMSNPWDESVLITDVVDRIQSEPDSLFEASPNPFNSRTTIRIKLKQAVNPDQINLAIYNVLGERIKSFDPVKSGTVNQIEIHWDGRNEADHEIATGSYFFVMTAAGKRQQLKLLYLK